MSVTIDPERTPTLLIPTRNRPTSLSQLLAFLSTFYPGTKIAIADGSDLAFQKQNEKLVKQANSKLNITYNVFPPEMLLIVRLQEAMTALPDGYYFVGADDDFPIMPALTRAQDFLEKKPDYSVCGGFNAMVRMDADLNTTLKVLQVQSIENASTTQRCQNFAKLQFPTYYCIATRQHFLSRYKRVSEAFVTGYGDYLFGLHDLCRGKMKILKELSIIRTSNSTHSYIRSADRMLFLRNAETMIRFQQLVAADLSNYVPDIGDTRAQQLSEDLIFARICFLAQKIKKIDPATDGTLDSFYIEYEQELKDAASQQGRRYKDQFEFVHHALAGIIKSKDNEGEERFRATM